MRLPRGGAVGQRRRLTARGAAGVPQIATAAVERHFHTSIDNQLQTRLDEASAQATAALNQQQQALLEELRATCAPPPFCTSSATCLSQCSAVGATGTLTSALAPPPPPPRTNWTRRVPHPVLIGYAASLTTY